MNVDDLLLDPNRPFVTGVSEFLDAHPGFQEAQPRLYVKFQPAGAEIPHIALLDTGGHYCILDRDLAATIKDHLTEHIGRVALSTAHGLVEGDLYTHTITLIAELGEPLDVESTVFVSPDWRAPSFLGYVGFLDRLHFAVAPEVNRFYFGSAL